MIRRAISPLGFGRLLRLLLLVPFLAASLLPAGVMPQADSNGTLTLTLCSADGPTEVVIDLATGETHPGGAAKGKTCDWANGHGGEGVLANAPVVQAPVAFPQPAPVSRTNRLAANTPHVDIRARAPPRTV